MIGNEGLTSHGTQKNLIGYCYDSNLTGPNHSCGTDNIFVNAVIDSNLELARRYNSNGANIAKGPKGVICICPTVSAQQGENSFQIFTPSSKLELSKC